jgi:hypothetical protein
MVIGGAGRKRITATSGNALQEKHVLRLDPNDQRTRAAADILPLIRRGKPLSPVTGKRAVAFWLQRSIPESNEVRAAKRDLAVLRRADGPLPSDRDGGGYGRTQRLPRIGPQGGYDAPSSDWQGSIWRTAARAGSPGRARSRSLLGLGMHASARKATQQAR